MDRPPPDLPCRVVSLTRRLPAYTRLVDDAPGSALDLTRFPDGVIARGAGRSFGDAAYLGGGHTLRSRRCGGIGWPDPERGELRCGAGARLGDVAAALRGTGWALPVVGGTRFVTVGGAIASDIHGKNHRAAGSFGAHVRSLELVTADGQVVTCRPGGDDGLFSATVGGMGLTGVIRSATLGLVPCPGEAVRWRGRALAGAAAVCRALADSPAGYTAAWLDGLDPTPGGVLYEADPVPDPPPPPSRVWAAPLPRVPALRRSTIGWMNRGVRRAGAGLDRVVHRDDFVWSVDRIKHAHRLYGPAGFVEFQYSTPLAHAAEALDRLWTQGRAAGVVPWFAMAKGLGDHPSPGLLSFPRAGLTVTADYPYRAGDRAFFQAFTDWLIPRGGRFYLAKDALLTPAQYAAATPSLEPWRAAVRRVDPDHRFRSSLSDRLGLKPW